MKDKPCDQAVDELQGPEFAVAYVLNTADMHLALSHQVVIVCVQCEYMERCVGHVGRNIACNSQLADLMLMLLLNLHGSAFPDQRPCLSCAVGLYNK